MSDETLAIIQRNTQPYVGIRQTVTMDGLPTVAHRIPEVRVESYLTDPGLEPDASKWRTELASRLAD